MEPSEPTDPADPSPFAVKCGRFVLCLVGGVLVVIAGCFAFANPGSQVLLTSAVLGAGVALVWLGVALPPRLAARFVFGLG